VGDDPALAPLKQALTVRTAGNPLFLEESVRTLVETKALAGQRGAYHLVRPLEAIQVPATVQAILASRIDRLAADEKRLLQSAAVIGTDVPFLILRAITDEPEETLRRGLAHLQSAEFLYETALFPDPEYTFKHALTHEVAYASLLQDTRRVLHARIVAALERLHPERLAEQVERLAHHAFRAEEWEKAVHYLEQAGTRAEARSAHREAASLYEQALAALGHSPNTPDRRSQAMGIRSSLRSTLVPLSDFGQILKHLRAIEADAIELGDQQWLGWVSVWLGECFRMSGNHDRAAEAGERGLLIAQTRPEDWELLAGANFQLGLTHRVIGRFRAAVECLRQSAAALEGRDAFHPGAPGRPNALGWLAWSLAMLGEFDEAAAVGAEGVRLGEASSRLIRLTTACAGHGAALLVRGDLEAALGPLERGLSIARDHVALTFGWLASAVGHAYALGGRPAAGIPLVEEAVAHSQAVQRHSEISRFVRLLAECHHLARQIDPATKVAREALDLARRHGERGNEAEALRVLGEVAIAHGDMTAADAHLRDALALAQQLAMRPLVAHCHLGLGKLSRLTGKRQEAQKHLTTATTMYGEMRMTYWLEQEI
jgi:tetratricopeptide (TPR) repeat protein